METRPLTSGCCDRTTDSDIDLSGCLSRNITMTSGGSTGHSDQFGLSCNKALVSGSSPDHRHPNDFRWQHTPGTSTQTILSTPAATAPWTQTWLSVAAWAGTSPWPQVAAQTPHIRLFLSSRLLFHLSSLCANSSSSLSHLQCTFAHRGGACHGLWAGALLNIFNELVNLFLLL